MGVMSIRARPQAVARQFVMVFPAEADAERQQINIVLNWFEELKERVPVP